MAVTTDAPTRPDLTVLTACCAPPPRAGAETDGTAGAASAGADADAQALADLFKALADPARVKIMAMLLNAEEVCACDISGGIGKSAATASHHLKILKDAGLASSERRGTWVYYRAVPQRLDALVAALAPGR